MTHKVRCIRPCTLCKIAHCVRCVALRLCIVCICAITTVTNIYEISQICCRKSSQVGHLSFIREFSFGVVGLQWYSERLYYLEVTIHVRGSTLHMKCAQKMRFNFICCGKDFIDFPWISCLKRKNRYWKKPKKWKVAG